jgi:hypothetical protein
MTCVAMNLKTRRKQKTLRKKLREYSFAGMAGSFSEGLLGLGRRSNGLGSGIRVGGT